MLDSDPDVSGLSGGATADRKGEPFMHRKGLNLNLHTLVNTRLDAYSKGQLVIISGLLVFCRENYNKKET